MFTLKNSLGTQPVNAVAVFSYTLARAAGIKVCILWCRFYRCYTVPCFRHFGVALGSDQLFLLVCSSEVNKRLAGFEGISFMRLLRSQFCKSAYAYTDSYMFTRSHISEVELGQAACMFHKCVVYFGGGDAKMCPLLLSFFC